MTADRTSASTPASSAAITVAGLAKRYDERAVVDGIDLSIEHGDCFALLGPNGAGKTTTLEILAGFRRRDAGAVSVLGRDPAHADRAWRARVGVVGQELGAALDLSVAETVRHFAAYHGDPRPGDELIDAVGLTEQRRIRVSALSGGQRRRLDVALGVQGRPELLFLDEPTTGLDPRARRQFWTLIERLGESGTTIVLTTHYLDEAARLADRVAVISAGRLVDTAPPDRIGAGLRLGTTVSWTEKGHHEEVVTSTPTAVLRDLLARYADGEIDGLDVHRPSLEDVYLALIDEPAESPVSASAVGTGGVTTTGQEHP